MLCGASPSAADEDDVFSAKEERDDDAEVSDEFFRSFEMTDDDEALMAELSLFRWRLGDMSLFPTCDSAVTEIQRFRSELDGRAMVTAFSPEILLSARNILAWEEYNYLYEKDIAHPALEPLIKAQYREVKKYFKAHKKEAHSKWLYTTAGDILSCCMQFLPIPTAMNEGLTIKRYYDCGVKADPDMVFCLINIAQWYFYAPVVNGGGKGKARRALEHAVDSARNDAELYYAKVLLSQVLFEEKKFERAAALLDEADSLLPNSRTVRNYRRINGIGHSYFDYTVNRRKIDAKLRRAGLLTDGQ